MSLRQYWRDMKHRFNHLMFEDFPAERVEAAEGYAKAAYASCLAWYGPPLDAQKPYCVAQAVEGSSFCKLMFGKYYLAISKEVSTPERLCSVIAHEMYHRVTAGRKGLASEMWVQEVMACLTSHWFLRNQGFQEYTDHAKGYWLSVMGRADVQAIRACRRRKLRDYILRGGSIYPNGFGDSVIRTGFALNSLLDEDDLRRMVKATTLEEWITSLPPEKQYGVCRLLEVKSDTKKVPQTTPDIHQFFNALVAKGDKALVVAELLEITHLQPSNGTAFIHLGRAYHNAEDFEAARDAYLTVLDLKFPDKWLPYNLGSVCSSLEDYSSAVTWYQGATRQDPDWARAYYFQGWALLKASDLEGAITAWEKAATLSDEDCARWAREALQENPLPTGTSQE